ncbi:hypothetical protein [Geomonas subterranea]|uniref:hypothetical protein n=1 Tax=Geomonas subterranea TaxID=2847989 RepID=UPI001CD597B3|nr:hypothetical protein [Geomonas fuzhouensis]
MNDIHTPREHHFYIAIAKFVFLHPTHGIVFVRDPISLEQALGHGLHPIILYGITVAGTSISWLTFAPLDTPRSFCEVLQEAWKTAPGLLGPPDVLKINRHVSKASPSLPMALAKVGVQVLVADGKDKQFSSSLRSSQQKVMWLNLVGSKREQPVKTLALLCEAAKLSHYFGIELRHWEGSNKGIVERTEAWIKLPCREMAGELPLEIDWVPGPWLSGWEATLPPSSPRYFLTDRHEVWLLTGRPEENSHEEDSDPFMTDEDYEQEIRDLVKAILGSWPNRHIDVARELGITGQFLKWYLSGRAELPRGPRTNLLTMFGISMDDGYYIANGPCVLIARSQKAEGAYEALSCGGDIERSFEALPEKANLADPSWRYIVFQRWGGAPCIFMVPRGSLVAEQLAGTFMNFEGQKIVTMDMYRDIVATSARACTTPWSNRRETAAFGERHLDYLEAF